MEPRFPNIKTPYPKVKISPTLDDCMHCIRVSDYAQWIGATAASWGYGFVIGRPARFAIAGLMAGLGFTFGSFVVIQNTRARLMGFRENVREQEKFGVEDEVESKMDWKSYT